MHIQSDANVSIEGGLAWDYSPRKDGNVSHTLTATGTPWGSAWGSPWTEAVSTDDTHDEWLGANGSGYKAQLQITLTTGDQKTTWHGTDYRYT